MLLESKTAVVYGGGGSVGGAVARAFAREGARVFLAGRTESILDDVAGDIAAAGGYVETARVDALDEQAVDDHADTVVGKTGRLDVSFNAISHGDVHGSPVIEMPFDVFVGPIMTSIKSEFLTARAAARHMARQGSGVLMAITASTARQCVPEVGGTAVSFDAIESLCRQLASELGPSGIRVVWLLTTGLPEALEDYMFPAYGTGSEGLTRDQLIDWMRNRTMLNQLTSLADVGNVAAFLASDQASAVTASGMNLTYGAVPDRS